ncbi:kinase [Beauveria brongniartii RCEF 3172]|uniref:Kinase n=1 Tax=Beauveria brongniartii RCEF 3172 TaxID=1081107 RepID=A0A166X2X6_9HYPO|nr:kinase [Beauveria brongniartii RCEF 3172]
MSTVVVKLGGAAITDKSAPDTLSHNIDGLMDSVAHAYHHVLRPSGRQLILIHGAGSFGHPPAKKYQVKGGWTARLDVAGGGSGSGDGGGGGEEDKRARDNVKFGMALTRQRVLQLHLDVLQRLHARERMPILSVSTYDTVDTDNGAVTAASSARLVTRVQQVLDAGFVPLLFGDAVFDGTLGATILSGDALMYHLAERLPTVVERCVFVTDVAGIYTLDPKRFPDEAVLIKTMCCSDSAGSSAAIDKDDAEEAAAAASVDDVTGGMRSKWQWAKRIVTDAKQVREVVICRVEDSGRAIGYQGRGSKDHGEEAGEWTAIVR